MESQPTKTVAAYGGEPSVDWVAVKPGIVGHVARPVAHWAASDRLNLIDWAKSEAGWSAANSAVGSYVAEQAVDSGAASERATSIADVEGIASTGVGHNPGATVTTEADEMGDPIPVTFWQLL